jgi:hypothetical protein
MATATLQTDDNNDFYLPDGRNIALLTGALAVQQDIESAVLMRTTEDVYDTNNGVDYFGAIFTPQPNYDSARLSISNAITKVPDVESIDSLVITIDGNDFDWHADVVTKYGPLKVSS